MAGRNEIWLNYQRTLRQAEELETLGNRLKTLADQNAQSALEGIKGAWSGERSEDYCRKGQRMSLLLRQHGSQLLQAAGILRRTAVNTYQAEQKIIEIAERRKYT